MKQSAIRWLWSRHFLLSRTMLWLLFAVNGLGTVYGYIWYAGQIEYTLRTMPSWLVLFVPDSPTASLFFTLAVGYLLLDQYAGRRLAQGIASGFIRGFIEAFAVITSIKYGIWAVWMIIAGYMQGDVLVWQDWMLIVSHLGMAAEALLFARFFAYRILPVVAVALWTLSNDYVDYHMGVYPNLPQQLWDDLPWIERLTNGLSIISIVCALAAMPFHNKRKKF